MHLSAWIPFLLPLLGNSEASSPDLNFFNRRQLPEEATGVKTIETGNNVTIRYKEPKICETTEGVKSYSGYVDLAPDSHTFFWFFEARHDPENAPITLWLNGGPGSDSLIGLFQELGPCFVNEKLEDYINPHSWNEVSNVLFLSQPVGVGFSYAEKEAGSFDLLTGSFQNASYGDVVGRYPVINASEITTTDLAAKATWEVVQGFLSGLPKLDSKLQSRSFNLWTESYGGHWGTTFFDHFYEQNEKIANGTLDGVQLEFNTLGIINGLIDQGIQANYYADFAVNNTYGIKTVNDTVYNYMKFANEMPKGCQTLIAMCHATKRVEVADQAICAEATYMCRDNAEGPYYTISGRNSYDIRLAADDQTPPPYYTEYLNKASIQDAIGVDVNYTKSNFDVLYSFYQSGDFAYPNFLEDLEDILSRPVRVALIYGDADYTCNWFGGEAVSLATKYEHAKQFRSAGYTPFVVDGKEYGATREYGNFSFTRVYDAGHMVPFYQPAASLQLFNRTLNGWEIATGEKKIKPDAGSHGPASATHMQSSVALHSSTPLPSASGAQQWWA
ncbi:hypothetical protein N7457_005508 [Penicillium paradoxum]|uniref:uncharacterized protein n=1 Tax=Penicillium paradoxum TaxID=176176 RepID=UPI002546ADDE|nr:uncharacterized protein N7457_005508 [Penicillium paradoxum]KAJ5780348.1 hypothetical protein N7457_005508 [Penicillium paradoxum]